MQVIYSQGDDPQKFYLILNGATTAAIVTACPHQQPLPPLQAGLSACLMSLCHPHQVSMPIARGRRDNRKQQASTRILAQYTMML